MTSNLPNIPSTPPSSYLASRLAQAQGKPLPAGEAIASFVRHDDALAAFDVLSEQDYPVTALYLVNDGIRQVEYPVQPGYGRALISAAIQGAVIGLVFSVLMTLAGDSFISEALKYVPLSVAVFVLWQMYVLRRSHGGRYPMRTEAIPSRTVMYALPEYAQDARRVLGAHPRFSAAVAAARAAAAPEASQARAAQSTVSMNGAPVPTGAPKAPSYRAQAGSQPAPNQNLPERDTTAQNAMAQSAAQNMPAQPTQSVQSAQPSEQEQASTEQASTEQASTDQASTDQATAQKSDTQKRPAQRYGLRVDDPEEYAKLIQPKPQRPTPRPQGLHDKSSHDNSSQDSE